MDDAGYVWVTDRFADLVVSGGVNIYPAEAEAVLAAHPGVAEVVCIGGAAPGSRRTTVGVGGAGGAGGCGGPASHIAGANLTLYKCPRELTFVEAPGADAGGEDRQADHPRALLGRRLTP